MWFDNNRDKNTILPCYRRGDVIARAAAWLSGDSAIEDKYPFASEVMAGG